MTPLENEIRAYEEQRPELERQYPGKYVVFYGREYIGPFDTLDLAAHAAARWHGQSTFLIRNIGVNEIEELVEQITPENRHKEVDWGKPVGKEVW